MVNGNIAAALRTRLVCAGAVYANALMRMSLDLEPLLESLLEHLQMGKLFLIGAFLRQVGSGL